MQAVTADELALLTTVDAVEVSAGCELLSPDLTVVDDLTDSLLGGTVSRVMAANIHGTCTLTFDAPLDWGNALVRPYLRLTSADGTARFNTGAYVLTKPDSPLHDPIYSAQGFDRLYLLDRPVGDTRYVEQGDGYLDAIDEIVLAAGVGSVVLDPAAAAKTLPTTKVWPLLAAAGGGATTWLQIINELLAAIGYRGLWADQNGVLRSQPYVLPAARASEFTFDTGRFTILGRGGSLTENTTDVPNRWVFVQQNRPIEDGAPSPGDGMFVYDLPDAHPLSAVSRGMVWPTVVQVDAADQASLEARAAVRIAADLRISSTLSVTTGPFPVAGHADVFTYDDPDFGAAQKVQAARWEMDLQGADMTWTWERVTP